MIEVKDFNSKEIEKAIRNALKKKNKHELMKNTAYGDGNASKRIVKILEKPLPKNLIQKYISY